MPAHATLLHCVLSVHLAGGVGGVVDVIGDLVVVVGAPAVVEESVR